MQGNFAYYKASYAAAQPRGWYEYLKMGARRYDILEIFPDGSASVTNSEKTVADARATVKKLNNYFETSAPTEAQKEGGNE